jgi:hypothetical protein
MDGSVQPSVYLWKFSPFYSKFDEQGLPTHFPDGTPLSTVERRNIEDEFESQKRIHAEYLKVVDEVFDIILVIIFMIYQSLLYFVLVLFRIFWFHSQKYVP